MKAIMYDCDLKRPGCVLLQVMCGLSTEDLMTHFDNEDWLLHPTPGMQLYNVTDEQLVQLGKITREARSKR